LELEAAKSKEFYFLADAASLTLSLKLGGVPLATYKLESIELGLPLASADEALSLDELYRCLAPPRETVEIVPGPPPAPAPPGKEEEKKPPVPRGRFELRAATRRSSGLGLESAWSPGAPAALL
jgi:hypothetical protein